MSADNKELISKLEQIDQLLDENKKLQAYYKDGAAKEALKEVASIREGRGEPPKAPSVYTIMPIFPLDENIYRKLENEANGKRKMHFLVALGITVFLFILSEFTDVGLFPKLLSLGVLACIWTGFCFFQKRSKAKREKHAYENSVKTYENTIDAFRNGLTHFEQEKAEALKELESYTLLHDESYKKYLAALDAYGENLAMTKAAYDTNLEQIKQIDLVTEEYYHLVKPLISILKSGRAESYKEALNLAIREEREEQEAAARRAAEARREEIMRQQAEEERRHNQELERQQAEQAREAARRAENAERRQADEARERRAAEYKAKSDAAYRCARCAKHDACGRARGVPNCGAFEPKY